MKIRRCAAILAAKVLSFGCKAAGKQGVTMAGKLAMKIDPGILRDLSSQVRFQTYMVCGTNGKTTTNNLLASALEAEGKKVICNRTGSNMLMGVAAAFVLNASVTGKIDADYACIEVDEASAVTGNAYVEQVREAVKDEDAQVLVLAAKIESEIAELETYEERQMFLEEIGLKESGVNRLIKAAYALLKLRTFLTAGSDEVRAWTFREGMKAPQCAGVIHTDFERGFIRAEVIKYADFIELGGEAQCRAAGKLATEGKDYIVQDGDIMHFLFNV